MGDLLYTYTTEIKIEVINHFRLLSSKQKKKNFKFFTQIGTNDSQYEKFFTQVAGSGICWLVIPTTFATLRATVNARN